MTTTADNPEVRRFSCEETVRRLWDYLDHELNEADLLAIDSHLALCASCPPHFTFEHAFLAAVRAARQTRPGASATLRDHVRLILKLERAE